MHFIVDLRIHQAGDAVAVEAGDGLSAAEQAEVGSVVAWMLGLDQDFTAFYELARQEPKLARAVASGALDLEVLKTADLPTLELRKRLLAIKGVGDYAAANLLMLLGHYDFLPVDSWAHGIGRKEYKIKRVINE